MGVCCDNEVEAVVKTNSHFYFKKMEKNIGVLFSGVDYFMATRTISANKRGLLIEMLLLQVAEKDLEYNSAKILSLLGEGDIETIENLLSEFFINKDGYCYQKEVLFRKDNCSVGNSHWNYKNGKTKENLKIRLSSDYRNWRKSVFYRDNYKCVVCSSERHIHAHHIKSFAEYPELRIELSNGLTLCQKCHIQEHKNIRHGTT